MFQWLTNVETWFLLSISPSCFTFVSWPPLTASPCLLLVYFQQNTDIQIWYISNSVKRLLTNICSTYWFQWIYTHDQYELNEIFKIFKRNTFWNISFDMNNFNIFELILLRFILIDWTKCKGSCFITWRLHQRLGEDMKCFGVILGVLKGKIEF